MSNENRFIEIPSSKGSDTLFTKDFLKQKKHIKEDGYETKMSVLLDYATEVWLQHNDIRLISGMQYLNLLTESHPIRPKESLSKILQTLKPQNEKLKVLFLCEYKNLFPIKINQENTFLNIFEKRLTPTETLLLWLIPYFDSEKKIASYINITEHYAENCLSNSYAKLGASTITEASIKTIKLGMMPEKFYTKYASPYIETLNMSGYLTNMELCVCSHIATGRSNKEISNILSVSVRDIVNHLSNIFRKFGIQNRTQLAAVYFLAKEELQNSSRSKKIRFENSNLHIA